MREYEDGEIVKSADGTLLVYDYRDDTFYDATDIDIDNWRNRTKKPRVNLTRGRTSSRSRTSSRRTSARGSSGIARMNLEQEINSANALGINTGRKTERVVEDVEGNIELPNIARALKTVTCNDIGEIESSIDALCDIVPKTYSRGTWIQSIVIEAPEDIDIKAIKTILPNPDMVLKYIPPFMEKALMDIFNSKYSVKIKSNLDKNLSELFTVYGHDDDFKAAVDAMLEYLDGIGAAKIMKGESIKETKTYDLVVAPKALVPNLEDYPFPLKGIETSAVFKNIADNLRLNHFILVIGGYVFEVDDNVKVKYVE